NPDEEGSGVAHGIKSIDDEVGKGLTKISCKAFDFGILTVLALDADVVRRDAALEEFERVLDDFGEPYFARGFALAMELERLLGDAGDAHDLIEGLTSLLACGFEVVRVGSEIEKVGDRFERVVDFVRNGSGEASGSSQLFRAEQDGFRLLAMGDVRHDAQHANGYAFGVGLIFGLCFDPVDASVGPQNAVLAAELARGGPGLVIESIHGGPIVRMGGGADGLRGGGALNGKTGISHDLVESATHFRIAPQGAHLAHQPAHEYRTEDEKRHAQQVESVRQQVRHHLGEGKIELDADAGGYGADGSCAQAEVAGSDDGKEKGYKVGGSVLGRQQKKNVNRNGSGKQPYERTQGLGNFPQSSASGRGHGLGRTSGEIEDPLLRLTYVS